MSANGCCIILYRNRTDRMNIYVEKGLIRLAHTILVGCSNNVSLLVGETGDQQVLSL